MTTIIGGSDFNGVNVDDDGDDADNDVDDDVDYADNGGDDGGNDFDDFGDDGGNDVDDDGNSCCLGLGVLGAAEVGKLISPPPTKPHLSSSPFFLILNFSL